MVLSSSHAEAVWKSLDTFWVTTDSLWVEARNVVKRSYNKKPLMIKGYPTKKCQWCHVERAGLSQQQKEDTNPWQRTQTHCWPGIVFKEFIILARHLWSRKAWTQGGNTGYSRTSADRRDASTFVKTSPPTLISTLTPLLFAAMTWKHRAAAETQTPAVSQAQWL